MDGTIINTEHVWKEATSQMLAKRGFTAFTQEQQEFLTSLSGIGLLRSAEVLKQEFNIADTIDDMALETKQIAHKLFESGVEFIDGFKIFHQKLQQHAIPTSVATNADQASLDLIGDKLKLGQFFGKNLYSIEIVGNKAKPDPAIFLHAAKQLNVEPEECVVFEDSLFGFQAAKAAGMKCIAIKNNINQDKLNLAHDAISSYHEAEEALRQLPLAPKSS